MKYIDEYRDKALIMKLAERIRKSASGQYAFMEVCGGHTASIHRFGIPSLLPGNIRLVSGPGCPVCVTGEEFIDTAVICSAKGGFIIATFGDLMRVPGTLSSLEKEKAGGADIRVVLSGLEALEIARSNPDRKVVFLGIGFETTAPCTAATVMQAAKEGIKNFFLLSAHKVMPPAIEAIIKDGTGLDGFICPGHVAVITGASAFRFIAEKYRLGCVITGFEPTDLLYAILMLVNQANRKTPDVEIQYSRAVSHDGNTIAQKYISEVFEPSDAHWRGFGIIPESGLKLRKEYTHFDAEKRFQVKVVSHAGNKACICGEILRGLKTPADCPLFGSDCLPDAPAGACMVSNEGACNTYYKYRVNE